MSIYTENSRYKKAWDHVKKYGSKWLVDYITEHLEIL
jgi:hypothetical protein